MQLHQLPNQTAKLAPIWTTILKLRAISVHQILTVHALYQSSLISSSLF